MIFLKRIFFFVSIIGIPFTGLFFFLMTTTTGLYTTIQLINLLLPGTVHLHQGSGQLKSTFSFDELSYHEDTLHIQITKGRVHWQLSKLLHRQLPISLVADELTVQISGPAHHVIAPPFELQINTFSIQRVCLQYFENKQYLNHLTLQARLHGHDWSIPSLRVKADHTIVMIKARGTSAAPYPTTLHLVFTEPNGLRGQMTWAGDSALYRWQGQVHGPIQAHIHGTLEKGRLLRSEVLWDHASFPFHTSTPFKTHQGQLSIDGTLSDLTITSKMQIESPLKSEWKFLARIKNKQAEIDSTLSFLQGPFNTQVTTKGIVYGPQTAKLTFTILPGAYQLPPDSPIPSLPFKGGDISVTLSGTTQNKKKISNTPRYQHFSLRPNLSHLHWQAQGRIAFNAEPLVLQGQGDFSPQITGKITLSGNDVLIVKNTNYTVHVSPQLTLQIRPASIDITGDLLIPLAQLKPLSFHQTLNLSEDVVFVHTKKTEVNHPLHLSTDIQIIMGKDVHLDVKGLHGSLDGAIRIQQSPQKTGQVTGELTLRNGTYQAYGQNLTINPGQLLFHGGLTDSPTLHIRALRTVNKDQSKVASSDKLLDFSATNIDTIDVGDQTTVGIDISGRLSTPKINLFSIPANLSQSDILSLLILGKPASQASKSGGQLLLAAISSMNLDAGTKGLQRLSQLKQSLGIDLLVQNNTSYHQVTTKDTDNTAVVVGKSLSKRLYLSYNMGLLQTDSNVLTLKYLLNKFFSIQVTTSDTGNGLDVLYTHSKKEGG
jgi:hypothetical protein